MPSEIGPALCATCHAITYWRCLRCGLICAPCHTLAEPVTALLLGITPDTVEEWRSKNVFPLRKGGGNGATQA